MLGPHSGMFPGCNSSECRMTPTKLLLGQGCLVVSIVAGGLWASTQWTAAMLGNQPGLGTPLTRILGYPVYAPWRLFEWWYVYEPYAPEVFRTAGMFAGGTSMVTGAFPVTGRQRLCGT